MLNGLGKCDFPEFIRRVNIKRPGYVTEHYGWYTKSEIDFIGRQENLLEDFIEVLKIMKIDFDEEFVRSYGKVGVSPSPIKELTWPNDLRLETALLEYAGMIRYGYKSTLEDLGIDVERLIGQCA
jgi:hypothetical protein